MGSTPATKAKATASGTKANATVKPESISVLVCGRFNFRGCKKYEFSRKFAAKSEIGVRLVNGVVLRCL